MKEKKICKVKSCNNIMHVVKQGLCRAHYLRFIRHGFVSPNEPIRVKKSYPIWDESQEK